MLPAFIEECEGGQVTPYYQDDAVAIYHGDCREWMPDADVLVTDPPYGIRYSPHKNRKKAWANKNFAGDTVVTGDGSAFDPGSLLKYRAIVLFGANHYAHLLPPSAAWIVWDKRDGMTSNNFADCELVWTNLPDNARVFRHQWNGALRASERGEPRVHPTQKPLVLMRWILERCPPGTILDPFMGSGTTLVAAKSLNRKAVGIEIEERYCEIAARRCSQEVLGLSA